MSFRSNHGGITTVQQTLIMYNENEMQRIIDIEACLKDSINNLSDISGVPLFDINVKLKLLLPLANIQPFKDLTILDMSKLLYEKLSVEVTELCLGLQYWNNMCGAFALKGCSPIYHKPNDEIFVFSADGDKIQLEIKDVGESQSIYIEKKMHYLHSFRKDAIMRKGLYIKGFTFPILYTSIIRVNSKNKTKLVCDALHETRHAIIYEISRSVGCNNLPHNSISLMISYVKRCLKENEAQYIITAINNFLGFEGSSIKASGFKYLTERYVDYSYTGDLSYIGPLDKNSGERYYTDNTSLTNQVFYINI